MPPIAPHAGLPRLPGQQNQFPQGKSLFTLAEASANQPTGGTTYKVQGHPHHTIDTAAASRIAKERQTTSPELGGPLAGMFSPQRRTPMGPPKLANWSDLVGLDPSALLPFGKTETLADLFVTKRADGMPPPGAQPPQPGAPPPGGPTPPTAMPGGGATPPDPLAQYGGSFGGPLDTTLGPQDPRGQERSAQALTAVQTPMPSSPARGRTPSWIPMLSSLLLNAE
jgi:hypothetical protein